MEIIIEKSEEQIKERIEFWFLKYFSKSKSDFNGNETFTLFELLDVTLRNDLINRLNLNSQEIPVLVLKVSNSTLVINTTERFIRLENLEFESLKYHDFDTHIGFKKVTVIQTKSGTKVANVKTEGMIYDFGIRKRNGEIVYWKIPTGKYGFAFWNITKRCELIGRKFKLL